MSRGKKIGKLVVRLDRVLEKTRWSGSNRHAEFQVDLRFDLSRGDFHAQHEGKWYSAATKADLEAQIKKAVERTIEIEWDRYLVVDYSATAKPLDARGLPSTSTSNAFGIDADRQELVRYRGVRGDREERRLICGLEIAWEIVDYSRPWARPEDGKTVRSQRDVSFYFKDEDGRRTGARRSKLAEQIGDPVERDDDSLPTGAVLWTTDRERFLNEIVATLAAIDAKLVDLLRGDADELAAKLDSLAGDPSRLLPPGRPALASDVTPEAVPATTRAARKRDGRPLSPERSR